VRFCNYLRRQGRLRLFSRRYKTGQRIWRPTAVPCLAFKNRISRAPLPRDHKAASPPCTCQTSPSPKQMYVGIIVLNILVWNSLVVSRTFGSEEVGFQESTYPLPPFIRPHLSPPNNLSIKNTPRVFDYISSVTVCFFGFHARVVVPGRAIKNDDTLRAWTRYVCGVCGVCRVFANGGARAKHLTTSATCISHFNLSHLPTAIESPLDRW
jgi:hypothetical protein